MTSIPLSSVLEGKRFREDYGDLSGLKESLQRIGSIHPIVLSSRPDGKYDLVAGGRRFRAMTQIGTKELFHGSVLDPQRLGFLYRDEVPEDELREAELDENLYRLRPRWQEDVLLVAEVHELKRRKHGTKEWGQQQTAELLGKGYVKSKVSNAIAIAKALRAKDPDVLAAENFNAALSVLIKRNEEAALARLHKMATPQPSKPVDVSNFLDSFSIDLGPNKTAEVTEALQQPGALGPIHVFEAPAAPVESRPRAVVPLSEMFFHGESVRSDGQPAVMASLPDGYVNHIVTDIPYAIDTDNMDAKMVLDVKNEHDVEENLLQMPHFLREAFRLVKPSGFCVFFYDLDHHEKLQTWAEAVGWKVQRWPYIAAKTSACRNQAAQYNTTKNYEVAMFLRKDSQTVLRKPITSSWKAYDFATERRLYNNPFAKPFDLWKDIYDAIAFTGQKVLDPYCGEMSACRAAVNCGLVPYGIEKVEAHYLRGLTHMQSAYALVHGGNVAFV